MSPFTHIPPPDSPQLVNLLADPPPPPHLLWPHSCFYISLHFNLPPPTPPPPPPQSAVLFLESLFGQENVYTVGMVRNLGSALAHVGTLGAEREREPEHDCDGVCVCVCTVTCAWGHAV